MDLTSIEKIFKDETSLKVCPICGTPYTPYHSRQKTCGNAECIKANRNNRTKQLNAEKMAENPEDYRAKRRAVMRRYRQKKKALANREAQLKDLSTQWEKQQKFDEKISEYGLEYGKRSAEKILATVPKINVNIDREEKNDE